MQHGRLPERPNSVLFYSASAQIDATSQSSSPFDPSKPRRRKPQPLNLPHPQLLLVQRSLIAWSHPQARDIPPPPEPSSLLTLPATGSGPAHPARSGPPSGATDCGGASFPHAFHPDRNDPTRIDGAFSDHPARDPVDSWAPTPMEDETVNFRVKPGRGGDGCQ